MEGNTWVKQNITKTVETQSQTLEVIENFVTDDT